VAAAQDSGHAKEQTGAQEASLTDLLTLQIDRPIAVITNDNPEKRNAFDDAMDRRLWEILAELRAARAEEREPRFTGS
jgi:enoyl-CoA hydratase/carnithine racemase